MCCVKKRLGERVFGFRVSTSPGQPLQNEPSFLPIFARHHTNYIETRFTRVEKKVRKNRPQVASCNPAYLHFPVSVIFAGFPQFPVSTSVSRETKPMVFPLAKSCLRNSARSACIQQEMVTSDQISTINKDDDDVLLKLRLLKMWHGIRDQEFQTHKNSPTSSGQLYQVVGLRAWTMVSASRYITTCPGRRISELRSLWQSYLAIHWKAMIDINRIHVYTYL